MVKGGSVGGGVREISVFSLTVKKLLSSACSLQFASHYLARFSVKLEETRAAGGGGGGLCG